MPMPQETALNALFASIASSSIPPLAPSFHFTQPRLREPKRDKFAALDDILKLIENHSFCLGEFLALLFDEPEDGKHPTT